ncbi:MAG: glycoside hydrolase family 2 [Erysipelotrichaceae bacterium]|nr:glycoside hydrolase family 2 [Erysipelotrichaceae bacterium]
MNRYKKLYPRPQMRRDSFLSLDGVWGLNNDYIEVPFPKEAPLSSYPEKGYEQEMVYRKYFVLPDGFLKPGERLILHFTAIDQIAEVSLNGQYIGRHEGGYLPFEFDISDYLRYENLITVRVRDDLDTFYPYGKQSKRPHGMWYTQVSGIWGSVWLEAVPSKGRIRDLKINTTIDTIHMEIDTDAEEVSVDIDFDGKHLIRTSAKGIIDIDLTKEGITYRRWSPDDPVLYDFTVDTKTDHIGSYLAIRQIRSVSVNGHLRLLLNGRPLFINGVLDQGYYEEGIYLPEDPKEYLRDIRRMKELGFNLLRKHIKIEPEIFYYYCDREGMLVMQDMVNSGIFHPFRDTVLPTIGLIRRNDTRNVDEKRYDFFIRHSLETIDHLAKHPCIIAWTIYNEGWGQQKASDAYRILKAHDPSRLFDTASGWYRPNESDIDSCHIYFRNKVIRNKDRSKVLMLSEFGGYVRKIEGHVFDKRKANYGYGKKDSEEELTNAIFEAYMKMVIPSIKNGLCGSVYTQVSDVEEEVNGLYTYDRQICKVDKEVMRKIKDMLEEAYLRELR